MENETEIKKRMEKDHSIKDFRPWIVGSLTLIAGSWLVYWWLISKNIPDYLIRGQFGDMFGAINALFTGLAFAGLLISIRMQSKELKIQSDDLKFKARR